MDVSIILLDEPVKLCAICRSDEESCQAEGPHIYDGLNFPLAVVQDETGIALSFHLSKTEAYHVMKTNYSG